MTILNQSANQSYQISQLGESVAICEALAGDHFNWNNGTETSPAFLVYVGCRQDEVPGYIKTFNIFYRCYWCEIRQPKYLKEFEAEIKIRGMQRESDSYAFGLDDLLKSEEAKHFGSDYTSGVMETY
jgi:hypothetical protein